MPSSSPKFSPVIHVGAVTVEAGGAILKWSSGLAIDADGSPRCYHPGDWGPRSDWDHKEPLGLDSPENGGRARRGHSGLWEVYESWGWATHDGTRQGAPIIQGPSDPAPGFYTSTTTLQDERYPRRDPRRYMDAEKVPYLALPPEIFRLGVGVSMGDLAMVTYKGRRIFAIAADRGPAGHLGEGSLFLAKELGIPGSPLRGGVDFGVTYHLFAGSGDGRPLPLDQIYARGAELARVAGLL